MSKPKMSAKKKKGAKTAKKKTSPPTSNLSGDEGISMSQQCRSKLQKRKRSVSRPKKNKTVKLCGNGVIMPSLEDLEKMYADSESEDLSLTDQDNSDGPLPKRSRDYIKFSKSIFNAQSEEIVERLKKKDNGSDSDSTVTYEIPSNAFSNPHRFSPLPSTSKDRQTFLENDKRLNESTEIPPKNCSPVIEIKNSSKSQSENIENDTEKIKIVETIVLDDDGYYKALKNKLNSNEKDLEVIQGSPIVIDDDSDYLPQIDLTNKYTTLDAHNIENNEDTKVINIDEVMAENNAVLEKYNKCRKLNNITHVVPDSPLNNVDDHHKPSEVQIVDNENEPISVNICDEPTSSCPRKAHHSKIHANRNSTDPVQRQVLISSIESILGSFEMPSIDLSSFNIPISVNNDNNLIKAHLHLYNQFSSLIQKNMHNKVTSTKGLTEKFESFLQEFMQTRMCLENNTKPSNPLPKPRNSMPQPSNPMPQTSNPMPQPSNPVPRPSNPMPQPPPKRGLGDCPICMDPLGDRPVVATVCGHIFCKTCIEAAIRTSGKKCPTCRMSLKKPKPYHQLFL